MPIIPVLNSMIHITPTNRSFGLLYPIISNKDFAVRFPFIKYFCQGLLSLQRGQIVLLREKVNDDWWKVIDSHGMEGFVASCYLSLAFY